MLVCFIFFVYCLKCLEIIISIITVHITLILKTDIYFNFLNIINNIKIPNIEVKANSYNVAKTKWKNAFLSLSLKAYLA